MIAHPNQVSDQFAIQALAMCCQLTLGLGMLASRGKIALAVLPAESALTVLVHTASFVEVLRIVSPTMSLQHALESSFLPAII